MSSDSIYFDGTDDGDETGRYADWASQLANGVVLEVSDGATTAQVELTWDELAELHHKLTLTLLARVAQTGA